MHAEIKGATIPTLEVRLDQGEYVVTAHGELAWMTASVELSQASAADTAKPAPEGSAGRSGRAGRTSRRKRRSAAATTALTRYQGPGTVTFAAKVPGQIVPVAISPGVAYLVHSGGWLCATSGITPSVGLRHAFHAGPFAAAGLVLTRLEGEGRAWVEFGGEVTSYELPPGQTILANPGHVGMFESTIEFAVTRVRGGDGLAGGDGLHLLALTGPGRIWLQSMPVPVLAHALRPFLIQHDTGAGSRAAAPRRAGG